MTCAGVRLSQIPWLSLAGKVMQSLLYSYCHQYGPAIRNIYTRYQPVHLWNTDEEEGDGVGIAATYKCINALDELSHAFSLAVSQNGKTIFCGLKGEVC